jgi:asparagine synthase (glutamine-hydrolysing)
MCGIAGAIGRLDPATIDLARRMNDCQRHRGPDGDGFWVSPANAVAFAHLRLAIIDLSDDARQPMTDPHNGNVLIFNGEIYNYKVLRRELEGLGHRFRTQSDTEVILRSYAQWGRGGVSRLRGMFTLAVRDAKSGRVLLARDRMGIKPLYWVRVARNGGHVILFASELRTLLDTGLVPRRIDRTGLASYLWNGFVVGPGTFIEGISLLPAGTSAVVDPADPVIEPEPYWQIPFEEPGRSDPDRVRATLSEAVAQHLLADVPVGVFLSGGVDSSAVAAAAVKAGSGRISTFNVSFDEAQFDEAPFARRVAEQLGTDHHELRLTQRIFADHLQDALGSLDQPTFDAINTYFVSRVVREAGLKVALAGTGGDELFGGYRSFAELPRLRRVSRACAAMPGSLVRGAARAAVRVKVGPSGEVPPQTRWGKLPDALSARGDLLDLYQVAYGLFTADFLRELSLDGDSTTRSGLPLERATQLDELIEGQRDLPAISALELSCFLGERLLRDTDAASMAVSLEVRVPLIDHELIESLAGLGDRTRYDPVGSKRLLREVALDGLDPKIFDRPKSGFVLPIEVWSRSALRDEIGATIGDRALCESAGINPDTAGRLLRAFQSGAPGLYWSRLWAVFVLLWWVKRHRVSI